MEHHEQCKAYVCLECFRMMVRLGGVVACPGCMRVQDVFHLLVADKPTSQWSEKLVCFVQRDFPSEWQLELVPHLVHHDETIMTPLVGRGRDLITRCTQ